MHEYYRGSKKSFTVQESEQKYYLRSVPPGLKSSVGGLVEKPL